MSAEGPDFDRVKAAVEELSKHFDTVQIFATRVSPREEGTVNVSWGDGNWFARYGQILHWIKRNDALDAKRTIDRDSDD